MKIKISIFILFLPLIVCAEQGRSQEAQGEIAHCSRADTLSEKLCEVEKRQKADKVLNNLYSEQINRLKNEEPKKRLRAAQRAWIEFRDKDCEYQGWATEQGSIHSLIIGKCLRRHTEQRIKDLEEFINCNGAGCPW